MSRRKINRRNVIEPPVGTRKGLFINSPYDDDIDIKNNLQTDETNPVDLANVQYVSASNTVGNIGTTSPGDLSKLKSPISLLTSPIILPKRNAMASQIASKSDRPLSPRMGSPKLISTSNENNPLPASSQVSGPSKVHSDNKEKLQSSLLPDAKIHSATRVDPRISAGANLIYTKNENVRSAINSPRKETVPLPLPSVFYKTELDDGSSNISQPINFRAVTSKQIPSPINSPKPISPRISTPKQIPPRINSPRPNDPKAVDRQPFKPLLTSPHSIDSKQIKQHPSSPRSAIPKSISYHGNIISAQKPIAIIEDVPSEDSPKEVPFENMPVSSTTKDIEKIIGGPIITPVRSRKKAESEEEDNAGSSSLPKIANRSQVIIDTTPPSKAIVEDEFAPTIGDKLTRNGSTYIYQKTGWKNIQLYEEEINSNSNMDEDTIKSKTIEKSRYPEKEEKIECRTLGRFMKDIPDYSLLSPEQQVYIRTRFSIKFDMIRDTWPQYSVPNPSDNMPLEHIHIMYNHYVKHIYARENAQTYMLYVIVGWLVMEIIAVKLLGLPAGKFIEYRMKKMGKYKILLIQLGEKYHGDFGEGWPVEVRIIMMSLIEMVLFIAVRWLLGNIGDNGVNASVDTVSNLIDRYFGITGVSNPDRDDAIPPPPEYDPPPGDNDGDSNRPRIVIPSLPEEPTDITKITGWIPTITNTLGLNKENANPSPNINSSNMPPESTDSCRVVADRVRARAASRRGRGSHSHNNTSTYNSNMSYNPPPFDS